ncbi:EamA family transporter RarD [Fredinandcohnia quinoae]|uniref:EamA family transporter RarD n=1 Tax=Fredinandcohnia quinoae TaxID=2918902 RepID=A0AAW5EG41_9BACI|nr:EamA family transporter RarD [Fredinandcohnia sp. SECRCQ15]MCH1627819.1 EamA family transporter RarD [Fredinandcohnia sp. SECRCQ15]
MNRTGMSEYKIGVIYTSIAYIAWGVLPLYWKLIDKISAIEILAHRVVWSFVFVLGIVFLTKKGNSLIESLKFLLKNRISLVWVIASSILISINWVTYIWAVNSEHIIEASLGYYINPLISVLLGIIVLKERLLFWQAISFIIAGVGVLILTIQYGSFPWVAVTLALSFGFYGLTKKLTKLDSLIGLTLETMVVTPIALLYLLFLYRGGVDAFSSANLDVKLLLIGAGMATALPLLWFASGAKRIPLSMIGILQYIAPTISLILGVFLYHEHFSKAHLITFICIWLALLIYSLSNTKMLTSIQPKFQKNKSFGA